MFTGYQQDDWVQRLPLAQYVHNSWRHSITKKSPYDLILGYVPHVGARHYGGSPETVKERLDRLYATRKEAQEAYRKAQELVIANQGQEDPKFKIGTKVWLDGRNVHTFQKTPKFAARRYGPFAVVKQVAPCVYKIKIPDQWKQRKVHDVFHASLLTRYVEMPEHGANFLEPPPDVQGEYEVEEIVASRRYGRYKTLQYLVKWQGYSEAENTWEPVDHVHAPELVQQFHRQNPTAAR